MRRESRMQRQTFYPVEKEENILGYPIVQQGLCIVQLIVCTQQLQNNQKFVGKILTKEGVFPERVKGYIRCYTEGMVGNEVSWLSKLQEKYFQFSGPQSLNPNTFFQILSKVVWYFYG